MSSLGEFSGDPLLFLTPLNFPVEFPTSNNRISHFDPSSIASDASQTCIILHSRLPGLFDSFLEHKRAYGSQYEKSLYTTSKTFTWKTLATRLITKRPLAFLGPSDYTLLRGGKVLVDSRNEWDRNGTEQQCLNTTLNIEEYLSYDEIMLSSLIGASGPTHFINTGSRENCGNLNPHVRHQERGIIIGLVGARFERPGRMDSVHILPPTTNTLQHPELSKIFEEFFGGRSQGMSAFDHNIYKARMSITVETLLLEANDRASKALQTAYVHVVGLGLGVWQAHEDQPQWFVETFINALHNLELQSISMICFSWIDVPFATREDCIAAGSDINIKVHFSKLDPAEPLTTKELLVVSYAWDGNAFPGNEYWLGSLSGSGDPAAACFSTIPELHNPIINPYSERIKVLPGRSRRRS